MLFTLIKDMNVKWLYMDSDSPFFNMNSNGFLYTTLSYSCI